MEWRQDLTRLQASVSPGELLLLLSHHQLPGISHRVRCGLLLNALLLNGLLLNAFTFQRYISDTCLLQKIKIK